jgi:hypothetical protein
VNQDPEDHGQGGEHRNHLHPVLLDRAPGVGELAQEVSLHNRPMACECPAFQSVSSLVTVSSFVVSIGAPPALPGSPQG